MTYLGIEALKIVNFVLWTLLYIFTYKNIWRFLVFRPRYKIECMKLQAEWLVKINFNYGKESMIVIEKRIVQLIGTNLFQIVYCLFVTPFWLFCQNLLVAFGEFVFQRLVTTQLFGWELCVVRLKKFYVS